ncbi:hypothetical protein VP01_249g4 [Puccinia sorghi]|uniref:Uncharacterized protein n=1 Tax=Puccinia sorghi TaxID=27349 RepID=A0A0L6V5V0_9BASI|nr:hypothetical protein VP01_249g4 [Puccinia sorghi]
MWCVFKSYSYHYYRTAALQGSELGDDGVAGAIVGGYLPLPRSNYRSTSWIAAWPKMSRRSVRLSYCESPKRHDGLRIELRVCMPGTICVDVYVLFFYSFSQKPWAIDFLYAFRITYVYLPWFLPQMSHDLEVAATLTGNQQCRHGWCRYQGEPGWDLLKHHLQPLIQTNNLHQHSYSVSPIIPVHIFQQSGANQMSSELHFLMSRWHWWHQQESLWTITTKMANHTTEMAGKQDMVKKLIKKSKQLVKKKKETDKKNQANSQKKKESNKKVMTKIRDFANFIDLSACAKYLRPEFEEANKLLTWLIALTKLSNNLMNNVVMCVLCYNPKKALGNRHDTLLQKKKRHMWYTFLVKIHSGKKKMENQN